MRWRDQSGPTRVPRPDREEGRLKREKRPRIGVLVDSLRKTYQTTLLAGISEVAYQRDVDIVVFAGGVLCAPRSDGITRNFVFDLCDKRSLDGVIILGGALGNFLGPTSVADVCARLAPLPVASIAISPPGVPGLLVDEAPGLRQALEHLVVRHGCRHIAFIRGPSVNAEAEHRYAIYRQVLEERGLPFDENLVCEGSFEKAAGEAGVALLVDERKVSFDALAAANDYMALGAIPALQERDLQVPSDVAVIGFDDIEDARFSTPPLTTVRQPLYQQGEAALSLVLAQIDGAEVAPQTPAAT
jgi:DNA-binding LacI/PurR family transcriptional regulator